MAENDLRLDVETKRQTSLKLCIFTHHFGGATENPSSTKLKLQNDAGCFLFGAINTLLSANFSFHLGFPIRFFVELGVSLYCVRTSGLNSTLRVPPD